MESGEKFVKTCRRIKLPERDGKKGGGGSSPYVSIVQSKGPHRKIEGLAGISPLHAVNNQGKRRSNAEGVKKHLNLD